MANDHIKATKIIWFIFVFLIIFCFFVTIFSYINSKPKILDNFNQIMTYEK